MRSYQESHHLPPRAEMIRAMQSSDSAYEGIFYTAVKTTGIFCRPTCGARKPLPENVEFFGSAEDALASGYRPCKRCMPLNAASAAPPWVQKILQQVERNADGEWTDETLRAQGVDSVALRRWCKQHLGATFHAYVRARRLGLALGALQQGESIDGAAIEHGYASVSGFRDAFSKNFGVPAGKYPKVTPLIYKRIVTALGPMVAMAEARGVVLLEFQDRPVLPAEVQTLRTQYGYAPTPGDHAHLDRIEVELAQYFTGKLKEFTVPLHLPGSAFDESVWQALRTIPYGHTRTYGELASNLGKPNAARAVGAANGRNRVAIVVPCHRVIGADGALTGYGGGQARKAFLLRLERQSAAVAQL